ncbi:lipopolysaccharide assembly LapA domain-containing protein [Mycobacterium sp. pR1184]|uniref:lipopolysaccharide assembly LapA domain-containing protein n=1 Tax=Mycobacterium sp. pR1184 TaxID=3238981 RepID=UPI00351BCD48
MSSTDPGLPGNPPPKPTAAHPAEPAPVPPPAPPGAKPPHAVTHPKEPAIGFTRAGALWSALIAGFLILILLLIFITQNTTSTPFQFLVWHWSLPLGVAILLAAVVGGLLTVAVGTARILQLRRAAKKHHAAAVRD